MIDKRFSCFCYAFVIPFVAEFLSLLLHYFTIQQTFIVTRAKSPTKNNELYSITTKYTEFGPLLVTKTKSNNYEQ